MSFCLHRQYFQLKFFHKGFSKVGSNLKQLVAVGRIAAHHSNKSSRLTKRTLELPTRLKLGWSFDKLIMIRCQLPMTVNNASDLDHYRLHDRNHNLIFLSHLNEIIGQSVKRIGQLPLRKNIFSLQIECDTVIFC